MPCNTILFVYYHNHDAKSKGVREWDIYIDLKLEASCKRRRTMRYFSTPQGTPTSMVLGATQKNMSKLLARRNSKGASSRRLELIVVIARMLDITLGSSLFLRAFHLLCSLTLHLALRELTIILWRQRVKGKFIGIQAKGKLPNKTWVPKSLADHYWRPLLGSPRSEGFMRKGR
jgi:hypothetical protein